MRPDYYRVLVPRVKVGVEDDEACLSVIECRRVIDALGLSYHHGTAFAYLWRAGRKTGAELQIDLEKAATHIAFELERLRGVA